MCYSLINGTEQINESLSGSPSLRVNAALKSGGPTWVSISARCSLWALYPTTLTKSLMNQLPRSGFLHNLYPAIHTQWITISHEPSTEIRVPPRLVSYNTQTVDYNLSWTNYWWSVFLHDLYPTIHRQWITSLIPHNKARLQRFPPVNGRNRTT